MSMALLTTRRDHEACERVRAEALHAQSEALCAGIRGFKALGAWAGKWWTVQFLIRRCAWHMLDHAWEMEDRDQS
jgi:hypothetical protein